MKLKIALEPIKIFNLNKFRKMVSFFFGVALVCLVTGAGFLGVSVFANSSVISSWTFIDFNNSLSLSKVYAQSTNLTRPYYNNSKILASTGNIRIHNRLEDSEKNYYLTGLFNDTVNFAADWGEDDEITATGSNNIFITKINSNGSYVYTRTIPSNSAEHHRADIDGNDNIYLAGYFTGTVNFAAGWGETDSKTSAGGIDGYITKINNDGSYGWTKIMGGTGNDALSSVKFDSANNLYTSGLFRNTVNFAQDWGSTDSKASAGNNDAFITKINADGSYGWTKTIGGTGTDSAFYYGYHLTLDLSDNIYMTGSFSNTVNFAQGWGSTDSKTSAGNTDIFLTKISADGSYIWTKVIGGTSADDSSSIIIDSNENLYLAGRFTNTVNFAAPWSGTDNKSSQGGSYDVFITKINNDDTYSWTRVFGGSALDDPRALAVDTSDNIFIGGYFQNTVNFAADWGETDSHISNGATDGYIIKVNSDSSYGWVRVYGSSDSDYIWSLNTGTKGEVYATGVFSASVDFGAMFGSADSKTSLGAQDAILLEFTDAQVNVNITESNGDTTVYENGDGDSYNIVLNAPVTHDVVIDLEYDSSQLVVDPKKLTFTTDNWQTPQTVTVLPIDGGKSYKGDTTSTIAHTITTEDELYTQITAPSVTVYILGDKRLIGPELRRIFINQTTNSEGKDISARYINDPRVKISIKARDDNSTVKYMRVDNNPDFKNVDWREYKTDFEFEFNDNEEIKNVYLQFRNSFGTKSKIYTQNTRLKTSRPQIELNALDTITDTNLHIPGTEDYYNLYYYTAPTITLQGTVDAKTDVIFKLDGHRIYTIPIDDHTQTWSITHTFNPGTQKVEILAKDRANNESLPIVFDLVIGPR